jgi:hypothetical protein
MGDRPPVGLALKSTTGRIALVATVAASGMASLDASVLNVALPQIGDDFAVGLGMLQWVLTGNLLASASLIFLGGALGDQYGRCKVFLIGTVFFAAASLPLPPGISGSGATRHGLHLPTAVRRRPRARRSQPPRDPLPRIGFRTPRNRSLLSASTM